jgi:hypothetical protein
VAKRLTISLAGSTSLIERLVGLAEIEQPADGEVARA